MLRSKFLVLALAAALLPTTSATWYGFGSHEPDNRLDSALFMWFDPPGPIKDRVYFNVYTTPDNTYNTNVGALNSDIEPIVFEAHTGILGVWIDCNNDGYIGMAETAVREYANDLLLDKSRCQPSTGLPNKWNGDHNYNGWVTELVPIVNRAARNSGDARMHRDIDAMVWGDYGTPTGEHSRPTCPLRPFPTGTTRSTGGFLNYADCRVSQAVGDESDLASNYNGLMRGLGNPGGLALADDENWRESGHPLNQDTFGSSSSDDTIVRAQDCNEEYLVNWGDLPSVLNDFDNRGVRPPDLDYLNPDGTLPGTVNYTTESAPLPTQTGGRNSADCNPTNDDADEFYTGFGNLEGDHPGIGTNPKTKADFNFNVTVTTRGGAPLGVVRTGAGGASSDAGLEPYEAVCVICDATEWHSDWTPFKPTIQVIRGNVRSSFELPAGYFLTYYASLGAASAQWKTPGSFAVYGDAQCGHHRSGVRGGWNCNPDAWNFHLDGQPMDEPYPLARIGAFYHLRDVDCYDNSVANVFGVDVAAGPAAYGTDSCGNPP